MKNLSITKSLLALSLLSVLAACDSDDPASPMPEPIPPESRSVAVNLVVPQIVLDDLSTASDEPTPYLIQTDGEGFQHLLMTEGYTLCYSDTEVIDDCRTISLNDTTIALDITGNATFTLTHPQNELGNGIHFASPAYTATGIEKVGVEATEVTIEVANTEWQYVTLEMSNDVKAAYINGENLDRTIVEAGGKVDYNYSYGYVLADSILDVNTHKYGSLTQASTFEAATHLPYRINFNENGSIVIGDPNFKPIDIDPIAPAEPVFVANVANSGGLDYDSEVVDYNTGAVSYLIKDSSKLGVPEAYTYTVMTNQGEPKTLDMFTIDFAATVSGDNSYPAVMGIYVNADPTNSTLGDAINLKWDGTRDEETGEIMVRTQDGSFSGYYLISDFSAYYVPAVFGEDLAMGNFFVRYNDDNLSIGQTVTITEYSISVQ